MGDDLLDSMIGLSSNSNVSRHSLSSLDTLEVINAEMSSSQTYMEMSSGYTTTTTTTSTPPAMVVEEEDEDHDSSSTGYLQDVLFEFTSKRRRLQLLFDDHQPNYSNNQHFHYWNKNYLSSNFIQNYSGNFGTLDLIANAGHALSDNQDATSETYDSSSCNSQKESTVTGWTTDHAHDHDADDKRNIYCTRPIFPSGMNEKIKRKRVPPKIVYPFALVKPGGFEGDATLNDINERILMPPTRPVRHPVGEFACRPLVSPQGPGLSGKAVVAFTRVHTQGRGTITIIRTRG